MKITSKIAGFQTPDGGEMELFEHDDSFFIKVNGDILMDSRSHESELNLARLGCAHLNPETEAHILVGGLGLGYTARQCLDMTGPFANVTVCELMKDVVKWNEKYIGALANFPLRDKRLRVKQGDIVDFISSTNEKFDAILLDIDNGPEAMTDSRNSRLYDPDGIYMCQKALKKGGCLSVWSAGRSKHYENELLKAGLRVKRYPTPHHSNSKSHSYVIWVVAQEAELLPPGGEVVKLNLKNENFRKGKQRSNRKGKRIKVPGSKFLC